MAVSGASADIEALPPSDFESKGSCCSKSTRDWRFRKPVTSRGFDYLKGLHSNQSCLAAAFSRMKAHAFFCLYQKNWRKHYFISNGLLTFNDCWSCKILSDACGDANDCWQKQIEQPNVVLGGRPEVLLPQHSDHNAFCQQKQLQSQMAS